MNLGDDGWYTCSCTIPANGTFKFCLKSDGSSTIGAASSELVIANNETKDLTLDGTYTFKAPSDKIIKGLKVNLATRKVMVTSVEDAGYSITYNCDGATSGCPSNVDKAMTLPSPLPTPQKTGYTFGGWYTNDGLTIAAVAGATLTENTPLYAKWIEDAQVLTGNWKVKGNCADDAQNWVSGWGTVDMTLTNGVASKKFENVSGNWLQCTVIKEDNSVEAQWPAFDAGSSSGATFYGNDVIGIKQDNGNIENSDITVNYDGQKVWIIVERFYNVTIDRQNGAATESQRIKSGTKVATLATPERDGYTFAGWTVDGSTYDFNSNVTQDITIKANWKCNTISGKFQVVGVRQNNDASINWPQEGFTDTYTEIADHQMTITDGVARKTFYNVKFTDNVTFRVVKIGEPDTWITWDNVNTTKNSLESGTTISKYGQTQHVRLGIDQSVRAKHYDITICVAPGLNDSYEMWAEVHARQSIGNDNYYLQGDYNSWHTFTDPYKLSGDEYVKSITVRWDYSKFTHNTLCEGMGRCKIVTSDSEAGWNNAFVISNIHAESSDYTPATDCDNGDTRIVVGLDGITDVTFSIWKDHNGNKKVTIKAVPVPDRTINFYSNTQLISTKTVKDGEKVVAPTDVEAPAAGKVLEGWYEASDLSGDKYNFDNAITGGDKNFYAKWIDGVSVTFVTYCTQTVATQAFGSGGKATNPGNLSTIKTQANDHEVATFQGWYDNEACTGSAFDFNTTITANKTLYAKWEINSNIFYLVGDMWMNGDETNWRKGRNPSFTRSTDKRSISVSYIAPKGLNRFEVIRGNDWGYKVPMDVDAASPIAINIADGHMNFTLSKHQKVTITYNGKFSVKAEDITPAFVDNMYLITGENWAKIEKEDGSWVDMSSGWHGTKTNNKLRQEGNTGILILRDAQSGEHNFKISGGTDDDNAVAGINLFNGVHADTENTSACVAWKLYTDSKSPWGNGIYYPSSDNHWRNITFKLNNKYDLKLTFDGGVIRIKEMPKYTITYMSEGEQYTTQSLYEGRALTAPTAPTKTDYSFLGWSETEGGTVIDITAQKATAAKTYYAKFGQLAVETATLNKSSLTLYIGGDAETLTGGATPAGVSVTGVWSVSPAGIVTVVNGVVTPVAVGNATITYTVTDKFNNVASTTCAVSVQACQMTSGTRQYSEYNSATMFNNATAKIKFNDGWFVHVVDGAPKMVQSEDATSEWREIPTGETYSPAWTNNTYPLFYLKHVGTGKYLCRGNGRYGANGDWYYYVTTVVDEPTGDECLWFYDTSAGIHFVCRKDAGNTLNKSYMISNCNINGAGNTFDQNGAKPQVVCHYAPDPANNVWTKLATVVYSRSTNPDDAGMTFASNTKRFISEGNFTTAATSESGAEVYYTSSNTEVATVNPTTGEVTPLTAGQTTIKATLAALGCYNGDSKSYTLNLYDGYYVSSNIGNNTWAPNQYKMTDGAYTFTNLAANTEHKFKVTTGFWASSGGLEYDYNNLNDPRKGKAFYTVDGNTNICFKLKEAADVTIRINNGVITIESEAEFIDGKVKLYGGQGADFPSHDMIVSADGTTCSYTKYMGDNEQYNFKILDGNISGNDAWLTNVTTTGMTRQNHKDWTFSHVSDDAAKCYLKTNNAGDYTFVYTYATNKMSVIFPNIIVTFDKNGGSDIESQSVAEGAQATEPADPTKTNLSFKHWLRGSDVFDFNTALYVNTTLKAVYEATVTFMNGTETVATETCEENGTVTFPADPTRIGCTFNRWADAEGNTVTTATVITANTTFYAVHQATITFNSNGGTDVASITLDADQVATQPADPTRPSDGAAFLGWRLNGAAFDWTTAITENITLVAAWDVLQERVEGVSTFTLEHDYIGGNLIVSDNLTLDGNNHAIGNLTVTNEGNLNVTGALTVNDLYIQSNDADHKSAQLTNAQNITVSGAIYLDQLLIGEACGTLSTDDADYWYFISLPFDVSVTQGVYTPAGVKMACGSDYDVWAYDGNKRATTGKGWARFRGTMQAGHTYLIGFNAGASNTVRFRALSNTLSAEATTIATEAFASSNDGDANWNALGNPLLRHMAVGTGKNLQSYDNTLHKFVAYTSSDINFIVGAPFFYQGTDELSIVAANNENTAWAPARSAAQEESCRFCVQIAEESTNRLNDQLYVVASSDATAEYQQGRDMVAMNSSSTKAALISLDNYGMRLSVEDAPLTGNSAYYQMNITAPKAGDYIIRQAKEVEGAELYLTLNGLPIWNLSMSEYYITLSKGNADGYGLLINAMPQSPSVTTDIDATVDGDHQQTEKLLLNGTLYIRRGEATYTATGQKMK